MLHYQRNPTVTVPVDVILFDGLTPLIGQTTNLSCNIVCLDNGFTLDADNTVKGNPAEPFRTMQAYAPDGNSYFTIIEPATWPRGHYRANVNHASGKAFASDFTVGLYVDRRLAYSIAYTGSTLKLALWVEEHGCVQTDYTTLANIRLLDMAGGVVATAPDVAAPVSGTFSFSWLVSLQGATNYILAVDAIAPGSEGKPPYSFPLRVGLSKV